MLARRRHMGLSCLFMMFSIRMHRGVCMTVGVKVFRILVMKIAVRVAPLIMRRWPAGNTEVIVPGYTTVNRRRNDIG